MRVIRLIIISAIVLFLVFTGITLLFPSHMRISRAINIAASKEKVFGAINNMSQWNHWNHFINNSSLTHQTISGPADGYGAYLQADQLKVMITASTPDSVKVNWSQATGKNFTGGFNLLQLRADSLTVQWYFDFHFRWYPWEKMSGILYDKQLGPVMEESLADLKHLTENAP